MNISRGKVAKAQKVVIYGTEGVGKSTFASYFPNPVFIDVEGSTNNMDVFRIDGMSSYSNVLNAIETIRNNPGEIKTVVIDTIDWLERMIKDHILMKNNVSSISSIAHGGGYVQWTEELGRFLNKCSDLIDKGVNVVLNAHSQIRKQELPDEMGAYDRYELKLEKRNAPLVKEWADLMLFVNYKTYIVEDSKTKSKKATGGQLRAMHPM